VVASDLPWFRSTLALEPDAGLLCRPGDPADLTPELREREILTGRRPARESIHEGPFPPDRNW